MAKKVRISVDVELTEEQAKFLCDQIEGPESAAYKISGIARSAIQDFAEGGMMLDAQVTQQVLALTGPIESTQEIVTFIERGQSREDGRLVGKWRIDPTYETPLREIAENQGLTVDMVVQNLMDWGVGQGWAYQMSPDTVVVFFTKDDHRAVSDIVGVPYMTGTHIADWMRKVAAPPTLAEEEGYAAIQAGVEAIGADPAELAVPKKHK